MSFTDDEVLALTLMTMWALATGRAVPATPPSGMTEQELIDFWGE